MVTVQHDVPLAPLTTLGIGGSARNFIRVMTAGELADAVKSDDRILVLGGGSNLVVGDAGWPGLVVHLALPGVDIARRDDHAIVTAAAGVVWDDFVAQMVDAELSGVECMSGIPGLVGATPMQNVGAYGQEVADTITRVRALDRHTSEIVDFAPDACGFAYRTSHFKGSDRYIITEVAFRLERNALSAPLRYPELTRALGVADNGRAPLGDVRRRVIELRRGKGMVVDAGDPESRSAGSFFTNPIVDERTFSVFAAKLGPDVTPPSWPAQGGTTKLSAAWLIERAGFTKGYTMGRVGISKKHALALVNRGGGTAGELLALARTIQAAVREKLGIELVPEPVIVGE
jgi:UDP-N-acetylmuramate dehydrogenase